MSSILPALYSSTSSSTADNEPPQRQRTGSRIARGGGRRLRAVALAVCALSVLAWAGFIASITLSPTARDALAGGVLRPSALAHPLCQVGQHSVLTSSENEPPYRILDRPVPYRQAPRCDNLSTTGLGGGERWVRLPGDGVLPTQPPHGRCGAVGAAWVSGWSPGASMPPPVSYRGPGSYPGDGPQFPHDLSARHVLCFEGAREPSQTQHPVLAASVGSMQRGVLWEVWRTHGPRMELLRETPGFPNLSGHLSLVYDQAAVVADAHIDGALPGNGRATTFSVVLEHQAPKAQLGEVSLGCISLEGFADDLTRVAAQCAAECARYAGACRYFWATPAGRCCLKPSYNATLGVVDGWAGGSFYVLNTWDWSDQSSVTTPSQILSMLMPQSFAGHSDIRYPESGVGTRLQAYYRPRISGDFEFSITCMGECELWLAPRDGINAAGRDVLLTRVATASNVQIGASYDYASAQTRPQSLEAGRYYFLVALAAQHEAEVFRLGVSLAQARSTNSTVDKFPLDSSLFVDSNLQAAADPMHSVDPSEHEVASEQVEYESCANSTIANIINCNGEFLLWQLPDAPGCSQEAMATSKPTRMFGYCTLEGGDIK